MFLKQTKSGDWGTLSLVLLPLFTHGVCDFVCCENQNPTICFVFFVFVFFVFALQTKENKAVEEAQQRSLVAREYEAALAERQRKEAEVRFRQHASGGGGGSWY